MKNIWHFDPNTRLSCCYHHLFLPLLSPPPYHPLIYPFFNFTFSKTVQKKERNVTKKMCIYAQKIDKSGGSLAEEIFILERRARP